MIKTKKKLKMEKGITLVALIITIIVLLILAIVTIRTVQGDGIINYAQKAKNDYEREADAENTTLGGYLSIIESNIPGGNNLITNEVPGGETEVLPGEGNTEPTQQIGTNTIAATNSTITGEPYRRTNPIIPAGFMAIDTETSKWKPENGEGPEVDNGLVISDGTNEFVWVPVTSTIAAYGLGTTSNREPDVIIQEYDFESRSYIDGADSNPTNLGIINNILRTNYQNSEDFKTALTEDFNSMAESANKYGGFYVGRYEMSLSSDMIAQSKYGETSSNAEDEYTNTWYGLYARAKTYNTSSVKSSMIWGSQYDAMMTWMGEAANTTIGDNRNTTRQTGSVETDKIKNVYDLYGNSLEWTFEVSGLYYRVDRGGNYTINDIPSVRFSNNQSHGGLSCGSRLTIYVI